MRFGKLITAALTSVALVSVPAAAARTPRASQLNIASRASATTDSNSDDSLFRGRRKGKGGALVFILIAVVIAVGIYIVVKDKNGENPVSP